MFYTIYEQLCKEKKMSPSGVAVKLGINKSTVTRWKQTGNTPGSRILNKLADFFQVSTDYLLGNEINKNENNLRYKVYKELENEDDEFVEKILVFIKSQKEN
jgi:transcriptional regulator with XRE-family HTH domain